mmetsp:Transcript_488/g.850  ORF Transcript_488/g.850 Transcript_488/m.850 type:complete len:108 (+) Transcript_488:1431-1754(+)
MVHTQKKQKEKPMRIIPEGPSCSRSNVLESDSHAEDKEGGYQSGALDPDCRLLPVHVVRYCTCHEYGDSFSKRNRKREGSVEYPGNYHHRRIYEKAYEDCRSYGIFD